VVEMLKLAPHDFYAFYYMDIEAMAQDPDFESILNSFLDSTQSAPLANVAEVDFSTVYAYATMRSYRGNLAITKGEFNLRNVRDILAEKGFAPDRYGGVEIWTRLYEFADEMMYISVAFLNGLLIDGDTGYVKASIDISYKDEPSMYSNEDVKSIVDKLPTGAYTYISAELAIMFDIPGLLYGISLMNLTSGDDVLDMQGWCKLSSEAEAEANQENIEAQLKTWLRATQINSQLEGEFIEISAQTDITY